MKLANRYELMVICHALDQVPLVLWIDRSWKVPRCLSAAIARFRARSQYELQRLPETASRAEHCLYAMGKSDRPGRVMSFAGEYLGHQLQSRDGAILHHLRQT